MNDQSTPEAAVRRYLMWLDDPTTLVDRDAVARAEAAVAAASDPMTRLHALADLEHARSADSSAVVGDFVTHARAYAEAQSIPVAAFRAIGVPDEVLAKAGFEVGGRSRRRASSTSTPATPRAPQVPVDELKAAVRRLPRRFTLSEVANEAGGGSPGTVRRAVDEMISAGQVRRVGPKPDHRGPGRAPIVYELV